MNSTKKSLVSSPARNYHDAAAVRIMLKAIAGLGKYPYLQWNILALVAYG